MDHHLVEELNDETLTIIHDYPSSGCMPEIKISEVQAKFQGKSWIKAREYRENLANWPLLSSKVC